MRDVVQDNRRARRVIEANLPIHVSVPYSGLLLVDGKRLLGACVFDRWNRRNVEFTCVLLEHDIGMRIARRVAYYVFSPHNMGCHRCTATTPRSNTRAIKALETLGFRFEGIMREYFPDDDGMVYGLLRSEQKIMKGLR